MPNTPTSAPAVPSADSRPTTRPVWSTLSSCNLTTSGLTALSSARGQEEGNGGEEHDRRRVRTVGRRAEAADDRQGGDRRAPPRVSATGSTVRGSMRSARRPPTHVPSGDAGEDDADDARERLQGHPDVRRQQPSGEDLQHQHGAGGDEHERPRQPAVHRADRTVRAVIRVPRAGPPGAWHSGGGKHSDGGRACDDAGDARDGTAVSSDLTTPPAAVDHAAHVGPGVELPPPTLDARPARRGRLAELLRRYWATTLLVAAVLIAGLATGALWRPIEAGSRLHNQVAYGLPSLREGRWSTLITGAFFTR